METPKRNPISSLLLALATLTLLTLFLSGSLFGQSRGQQNPRTSSQAAGLPGPSNDLLAKLEAVYKDIHANPEISMQEKRTAGIAAKWL